MIQASGRNKGLLVWMGSLTLMECGATRDGEYTETTPPGLPFSGEQPTLTLNKGAGKIKTGADAAEPASGT